MLSKSIAKISPPKIIKKTRIFLQWSYNSKPNFNSQRPLLQPSPPPQYFKNLLYRPIFAKNLNNTVGAIYTLSDLLFYTE